MIFPRTDCLEALWAIWNMPGNLPSTEVHFHTGSHSYVSVSKLGGSIIERAAHRPQLTNINLGRGWFCIFSLFAWICLNVLFYFLSCHVFPYYHRLVQYEYLWNFYFSTWHMFVSQTNRRSKAQGLEVRSVVRVLRGAQSMKSNNNSCPPKKGWSYHNIIWQNWWVGAKLKGSQLPFPKAIHGGPIHRGPIRSIL